MPKDTGQKRLMDSLVHGLGCTGLLSEFMVQVVSVVPAVSIITELPLNKIHKGGKCRSRKLSIESKNYFILDRRGGRGGRGKPYHIIAFVAVVAWLS